MHLSYSGGDRFLGVDGGHLVWSSDARFVRVLWQAFRDGDDLAVALAAQLTAGSGGLVDFIVVETTATGADVLVRGDIDATVVTGDGHTETLSGRGIRTWREAPCEALRSLSVGVVSDEDCLPIHSAVVRAGSFALLLDGEARPPRAPETPTILAPEPVPASFPAPAAPNAAAPTSASAPPPPPAESTPPAPLPHDPAALASAPETTLAAPPSPPPPAPRAAPSTEPAPAASGPAALAFPPPPPPPPAANEPASATLSYDDVAAQVARKGQDEFDHLFESTVLRSPEDAAVRVAPGEDADNAVDGAPAPLGDHDGATILGSQLSALLRAGRATGLATPPQAAALQLVFSTGEIVGSDRPIIVGRKPQADRVSGTDMPRLVTVTGINGDISRSHVEIRPDGGDLFATDLGSTNGTDLVDARGRQRLVAYQPVPLTVGSRLDLGDGVTIDVRVVQ